MVKILKIIFFFIIFFSSLGLAKDFNSRYGFSIEIPDHFIYLDPEENKKAKKEMQEFSNEEKGISPELKDMMKELLKMDVEIFVLKDSPDNLQIFKFDEVFIIPENNSKLQQFCNEQVGYMKTNFKLKNVNLSLLQCKKMIVDGKYAIYLSFSLGMGMTSIQTHINVNSKKWILLNMSTFDKNFFQISNNFDEILKSIKFQ